MLGSSKSRTMGLIPAIVALMSLLLDLAPLRVLLVVQYGRVAKRTQNN